MLLIPELYISLNKYVHKTLIAVSKHVNVIINLAQLYFAVWPMPEILLFILLKNISKSIIIQHNYLMKHLLIHASIVLKCLIQLRIYINKFSCKS